MYYWPPIWKTTHAVPASQALVFLSLEFLMVWHGPGIPLCRLLAVEYTYRCRQHSPSYMFIFVNNLERFDLFRALLDRIQMFHCLFRGRLVMSLRVTFSKENKLHDFGFFTFCAVVKKIQNCGSKNHGLYQTLHFAYHYARVLCCFLTAKKSSGLNQTGAFLCQVMVHMVSLSAPLSSYTKTLGRCP